MEIHGNGIHKIQLPQQTGQIQKQTSNQKYSPGASAKISIGSPTKIERLKQQLNFLPEARARKLDILKQQIKDGSYNASPRIIAEKILSDLNLQNGDRGIEN